MPRRRRPLVRAVAVAALVAAALPAARAEPGDTAVHVQAAGGVATRVLAVGARRTLGWQAELGAVRVSTHAEVELGLWSAEQAGGGERAFGQATVAPVLQLEAGRWFGEVGIGPTWLAPAYRSRQRAFSSRLQFRDHVALGTRFGEHAEHSLDVRLVHVSNGGLEQPNPGVELVGVRYARRW